MNKLNIELENCYGIKKLKYKFDFTERSTYSIYAPNGTMKTSFANTFMDLSNGAESKDLIFKGRKTKRIIKDENDAEISSEQVFVIVPYNKEYKSNKISTLLVNKGLKEKYELIHFNIDEKKALLIKELQPLSGPKVNIEETFSNDFTHSPKEFFKAILRVKAEVLDKTEPELENKIVLAIAIRLKAEEFMVAKIKDDTFWKGIKEYQTAALIKKFKEDFPAEIKAIDILEQVSLMTPENIHLNSFMYEPILDMSNEHLKNLYKDIKDNLT